MSRRPDQHGNPRGRRYPMRPDINMAQLASHLGCSPGHLSDILHGRRRLTEALQPKLANALGIPVERVAATIQSWAAQVTFTKLRSTQ